MNNLNESFLRKENTTPPYSSEGYYGAGTPIKAQKSIGYYGSGTPVKPLPFQPILNAIGYYGSATPLKPLNSNRVSSSPSKVTLCKKSSSPYSPEIKKNMPALQSSSLLTKALDTAYIENNKAQALSSIREVLEGKFKLVGIFSALVKGESKDLALAIPKGNHNFSTEIEITEKLRELSHKIPGLPTFYQVNFPGTTQQGYLMQAYKTDLQQMLRNKNLPLYKKHPIALQIVKTLQSLAANGIAHRDLHPGNILLNEDKTALIDFDDSTIRSSVNLFTDSKAAQINYFNAPTEILLARFPLKVYALLKPVLSEAEYQAFVGSNDQVLGNRNSPRYDLFGLGALLESIYSDEDMVQRRSREFYQACNDSIQKLKCDAEAIQDLQKEPLFDLSSLKTSLITTAKGSLKLINLFIQQRTRDVGKEKSLPPSITQLVNTLYNEPIDSNRDIGPTYTHIIQELNKLLDSVSNI